MRRKWTAWVTLDTDGEYCSVTRVDPKRSTSLQALQKTGWSVVPVEIIEILETDNRELEPAPYRRNENDAG